MASTDRILPTWIVKEPAHLDLDFGFRVTKQISGQRCAKDHRAPTTKEPSFTLPRVVSRRSKEFAEPFRRHVNMEPGFIREPWVNWMRRCSVIVKFRRVAERQPMRHSHFSKFPRHHAKFCINGRIAQVIPKAGKAESVKANIRHRIAVRTLTGRIDRCMCNRRFEKLKREATIIEGVHAGQCDEHKN